MKSIFNRKVLTVFLLLLSCLDLFAIEPMTIKKNIKANDSVMIPLKLEAEEYIRGEYSLSTDIKSIYILDENKQIIRNLYANKKLEDRVLFIFDKKGTYYLKVTTLSKNVNFRFIIQNVVKKEEQVSSTAVNYLSPTLSKLNNKKDIEEFWEKMKKEGTPLIEKKDENNYIVTYFFEGAKNNVKIRGTSESSLATMNRLKKSDLWYKSYILPKGSRFSYRFAPDIPKVPGSVFDKKIAMLATAQADPYNKHPMEYSKNFDIYNKVSTFILPGQQYTDYSLYTPREKGTVTKYQLKSKILKNQRAIDLYTPKGFDKNKSYPIVFLFDGKDYQSRTNTPKILDNLIELKKIPATIVVFIDNINLKTRSLELPANEHFADFMEKELLPWFKKNITTNVDPKWSILSGSSYGGLASTFIAFKKPQSFKKVLSLSGSFWWKPKGVNESEWLTKEFAKSEKKDIELILYVGIYEKGRNGMDLLLSNRHLRDILVAKNYKNKYKEFNGTHDSFSWQVTLADGLIELLKDYK